jgi:hypothetical protein
MRFVEGDDRAHFQRGHGQRERKGDAAFLFPMRAWLLVLCVFPSSVACSPTVGDPVEAGPPEKKIAFGRDIRPLMDRSCKTCHYPTEPTPTGWEQTGLDLTTLGSLRQGGFQTGNSIVVPGNPYASALVRKLQGTYDTGQRMPRTGPYLTDAEIEIVELWIEQGAEGDPSE